MFYRSGNLRKAIGLMGVALALLSGVQQGHSLCFFAGCDSLEAPVCEADEHSGCTAHHACDADRCHSHKIVGEESASDSCPCPPTCWCHQSPEPLGLPTNVSVSLDLLCRNLGQAATHLNAIADSGQDFPPVDVVGCSSSIETAVGRCAQLCRFLI